VAAADGLAERPPLELDAAPGAARREDLRRDEEAPHERDREERLEENDRPGHCGSIGMKVGRFRPESVRLLTSLTSSGSGDVDEMKRS
jgi:hypothetical protein